MRTKSTKSIDNYIYLAFLLYHIVRTVSSKTHFVNKFVDISVDTNWREQFNDKRTAAGAWIVPKAAVAFKIGILC